MYVQLGQNEHTFLIPKILGNLYMSINFLIENLYF